MLYDEENHEYCTYRNGAGNGDVSLFQRVVVSVAAQIYCHQMTFSHSAVFHLSLLQPVESSRGIFESAAG